MPLPIQAIYPLGIVAGALIAGGVVLDHTYRFFNNGKPRRSMLDRWDRLMMDRDERLTGSPTVQLVRQAEPRDIV